MSGPHVLALSGGVGGAKLAAGLAQVMAPEDLTIAVNTGDDFEHLGLSICPDIDSVLYALAGLNDEGRGWGVTDETWQAMGMLRRLGEADWFNLGDRDLGTHIARSWRLRQGASLSEVTRRLAEGLNIACTVAPMTDMPVRTRLRASGEWMDFQRYFVAEQCRPAVSAIQIEGTPGARPSPALKAALERPDLGLIIVCPSNPYLSIDPMLAIDGVRDALIRRKLPVVAVSPLIGGKSVKGPLGKLLSELGKPVGNAAIAHHYEGLLTHLIIDESDAEDAEALAECGIDVVVRPTMMRTRSDQEDLARAVLDCPLTMSCS